MRAKGDEMNEDDLLERFWRWFGRDMNEQPSRGDESDDDSEGED
jgi:hypothetical protein